MTGLPDEERKAATSRPLNVGRAAWVLIRRFGCPLLAQAEATRRIAFCMDAGNPVSADEWRCVHRKIGELGLMPESELLH